MSGAASAFVNGDLHENYVAAISSNDTDRILALMSDDVVFQVSARSGPLPLSHKS